MKCSTCEIVLTPQETYIDAKTMKGYCKKCLIKSRLKDYPLDKKGSVKFEDVGYFDNFNWDGVPKLYSGWLKEKTDLIKRQSVADFFCDLIDDDNPICGLCGEALSDNPLIPHKLLTNKKETFRVCENCHFKEMGKSV